jgi:hypothetical protein
VSGASSEVVAAQTFPAARYEAPFASPSFDPVDISSHLWSSSSAPSDDQDLAPLFAHASTMSFPYERSFNGLASPGACSPKLARSRRKPPPPVLNLGSLSNFWAYGDSVPAPKTSQLRSRQASLPLSASAADMLQSLESSPISSVFPSDPVAVHVGRDSSSGAFALLETANCVTSAVDQ